MVWRGVSLLTETMRTSALPYWLGPMTMPMG